MLHCGIKELKNCLVDRASNSDTSLLAAYRKGKRIYLGGRNAFGRSQERKRVEVDVNCRRNNHRVSVSVDQAVEHIRLIAGSGSVQLENGNLYIRSVKRPDLRILV